MRTFQLIGTAVAALGSIVPVSAQTLPAPSLKFPQASGEGFTWGVSTGFDYTSGKYGAKCAFQSLSLTCTSTGTTVLDIPTTGMIQVGRVRFEATVPWVDIEGPGKFAGVFGIPIVVAPPSNEPKHRSGIGDITAGAAVVLSREDLLLPLIEIEGVIETADSRRRIRHGKDRLWRPDQSVQDGPSGSYRFWLTWLSVDRRHQHVPLHSGARATAGAEFHFLSLSAGGLIDYRQSAWQGSPDYFAFDPYAGGTLAGIGVIAGILGIAVYGTLWYDPIHAHLPAELLLYSPGRAYVQTTTLSKETIPSWRCPENMTTFPAPSFSTPIRRGAAII